MAGFKQRSLTLHQLQSVPNDIDLNTIDIFYLNDGSIRAKAGDGTEFRLDNVDSTLVSVSGQLYSLIQTVSGDLVVYVNSVSGSLNDQIMTVDSNAVHKTGDESINGIKTFGDVAYFMNGIVVNGEIIDVEVTHLKVGDNIISLNYGVTGAPVLNAGIEVVRGTQPNSQIIWNEGLGYWTAGISGGLGLEKIILQSDLNAALLSISGGSIYSLQTQVNQISGNVNVLNSEVADISANYTPLVTTSSISGNLQNQINYIGSNYTLLSTTASVSAYLQTQIDNISAATLTNYYTKTQTNAITSSLHADYTNADSNILSYVTTVSSQQKLYIDNNFVDRSSNQTISGDKSFVNTLAQVVLSTQNTSLYDSAGIASENWNSRFLYDNLGIESVDWKNRELYDDLLNVTIDWELRHLYSNWSADSLNVLSLPVSGVGNFLTWDASKKLIDSGININTLTANISSNLQAQITQISGYIGANTNSINTLFSTYANSTTVAAISAGLNTRTDNNTNSINTLFSTYTNSTTVAAISAGIESQISGNNQVITNSLNTLFSTYANSTTVAAISAGIESQLAGLSGTYASLQDLYDLDLDLQTQIFNNKASISTISSTYAASITVAAISAGIETQIIQISGYTQANTAAVAAISGYTQANTNGINTLFSTYANSTTVAAISAGLNNTKVNRAGDTMTGMLYLRGVSSPTLNGGGNEAYGVNALNSNTTGSFNIAIGPNTLSNNTVGISNIAIGTLALVSNISGNTNTAIAPGALQSNTIGNSNVALGYVALANNISGSNNTALGYSSLYNNVKGSGNIAIGYNAGYLETGSNTLYIDNQANNAATALIYSDIPNGVIYNRGFALLTTSSGVARTEVTAISAGLNAEDIYLQSQINSIVGISGAYALDNGVVHNYGNETINGVKTFVNTISGNIDNTILNVGVNNAQNIQIGGNNTSLINIGQGNIVTTINIGSAGDTVNILGDLVYVKTTNSEVLNKTITINASGAIGSSNLGGLYVQEGAISGAGYARIDNARSSWGFKAPANAGTIWLTPSTNNVVDQIVSSSTGNQIFNLQDKSGTIALLGDIPSSSSVVHTTGNEGVYGIKNFFYPSTNLSLSTSGSAFYDTATNKSIDWAAGILYANIIGNKSIDYANRNLYGSSGFVTVDYANKKLFDANGYTSYDWGQRLAWYNNNSTIAINFSGNEVAINDISGNKAFSSNRTLIDATAITTLDWNNKQLYGIWTANNGLIIGSSVPVSYNSTKTTGIISPNSVIDTIATSANEGASWKVIVTDGTTNKRMSNIDSVFTSSLIEYTEYSTLSIGDTSAVSLTCDISGGNARLLASAVSGTWTVKASRINF